MIILQTFTYAFFVGLLPCLIWLWFWLHEDKAHPEPRNILSFTFLIGMATIFIAIPLEAFFFQQAPSLEWRFLAWAAVEEILKFLAVFAVAMHTKAYDEPIDAIVYMMCAALGFAALENTLFILNTSISIFPEVGTTVLSTVFLSNLRFIGANLLHVVASSIVGVSMAISFYKPKEEKFLWIFGGISLAVILHTLFNLFIIDGSNTGIFLTFATIWAIMIALLLVFEKIKKMKAPKVRYN